MKALKLFWVGLIVISLGLTACGGADVKTKTYSTTLGQELKDLQEAYEKGIINKEQYKEIKQKLIEKRTDEDD
jgi:ABC-type glycerol-3-phosphate transport system substrate-binding protein